MFLRFAFSFLLISLACASENYGEWRYSKSVHLNAGELSLASHVLHFPLLLRLNAGNFDFGAARPDGHDIRFTRGDGVTRLPHQIERWDAATREAEVWVLVDTVRKTGLTAFRMYFGNAEAADLSNGATVFDTAHGHRAAFHLGEGTGDTARDATGNGFVAIPRDTASRGLPGDAPGVIGRAKEFAGGGANTALTGGYYALPGSASGPLDLPENGPYTISAWVRLRPGAATNAFRCIVSKSDFQYNLMKNNVENEWQFNPFSSTDGTPSRWERATGGPVLPGKWQYVVGVRQADNAESLYVDGVPSTVIVNYNSGSPRNTSHDVMIGRRSDFVAGATNNGNRFWDGWIDEVNIAAVARNSDWVRLAYATQKPDAEIVSFGEPAQGLRFQGPDVGGRSHAARIHYKDGVSFLDTDSLYETNRASLGTPGLLIEAEGSYYNQFRTRIGLGEISVSRYYDTLDGSPMFTTTLGQDLTLEHGSVTAQAVYGDAMHANEVHANHLTADSIRAFHLVTTPKWRIPDYVFEPGYARRSLAQLESFVRANRHLPDIPGAKEIEESGLDVGEMSLRLLKNVEELALHLIDLDKKNAMLEEKVRRLDSGWEAEK